MDGARKHPNVLISELANLAGDEQSGMVAAVGEYPPKFMNLYGIDRTRMAALIGDRLNDALELLASHSGDNDYAVRAVDAASACCLIARNATPSQT